MSVIEEFLAGLELLPPDERARALFRSLENVVAGCSTLANGQWEPDGADEIWMAQLLASTVQVYEAMLKRRPAPAEPEDLN